MRKQIIGEVWVCFDCHLHHHTKETDPGSERVPWCQLATVDVTDASEEESFSTGWCPACGTRLAGTRHKYAVWV